jgi:hypothetical protein
MRDGTSYMVGVIALAYVLNFGGEPDWLIASGEESGAPWREKSLLAFFGDCDEKDRLTGIGSAALGQVKPEIHRVDPEFGSTLTVSNRDSLNQTAGSTCEFWVNPVNFTFKLTVISALEYILNLVLNLVCS